MKNMNDKTKKSVILAGGLVISVALVLMIGARFTKAPVSEEVNNTQNTEISEVVVENPNGAETNKNVEVKVEPIEVPKETELDSGADDTGTDQKIQGDVPDKPTYTEEQLTDPTQKPDGEKVDPPKSEDKNPTTTTTPKPNKPVTTTEQKPSGGLPGFDSVPDGGANQVINGESDGDINKEVGSMD
jgi:outer membrane biosynthesis protein TonB